MNFYPPLDQSARATAIICGAYRYKLTRTWGEGHSRAIFVMLNPSTADADTDDPTIRKCMNFSRQWELDGLLVYNLFAYRTSDPRLLNNVDDPIGPENDKFLIEALDRHLDTGAVLVCAWGVRGGQHGQAKKFLRLAITKDAELHALSITRGGYPKHPLYAPYRRKIVSYGY